MGWQAVQMDKTVELQARRRYAGRSRDARGSPTHCRAHTHAGSKAPLNTQSCRRRWQYRNRQLSRRMTGSRPKASSSRDADRAFMWPVICRLCHWPKSGRGLTVPSTHSGCRACHSMQVTDMAKPGCGWLPSSWMPEAGIRRALRALARADNVLPDRLCIAAWAETACANSLHAAWMDMALRRRPTRSC